MFIIEDEFHAEQIAQFASFEEAIAELRRRAKLPWDKGPNMAPCMSWQTCGREYVIIEYDDSQLPWKELRRIPAFKVSAAGVEWVSGFGDDQD